MNSVSEIEPPKTTAQSFHGCRGEACESEAVQKIEQSVAYMLQHLGEPLQVASLVAQAKISPSHFFALFKLQTGCAPIDCFNRLRMKLACRLLDETGLIVKEVAAALGYDDPFYFSRIFKSVNHVAPSEYRLLDNGAREAVRNGGINMHRFHLPRLRTDLESARLDPDPNRNWVISWMETNITATSEPRLLDNGAREAVRNGGINLRRFPLPKSRTDLESARLDPDPNRNWIISWMENNVTATSGFRNGGNH